MPITSDDYANKKSQSGVDGYACTSCGHWVSKHWHEFESHFHGYHGAQAEPLTEGAQAKPSTGGAQAEPSTCGMQAETSSGDGGCAYCEKTVPAGRTTQHINRNHGKEISKGRYKGPVAQAADNGLVCRGCGSFWTISQGKWEHDHRRCSKRYA